MMRQARLKPEFAHLYPGVEPDTWHPAAALADRVLGCRLLLPSGGFVLHERAMSGGHFEFRGGARASAGRAGPAGAGSARRRRARRGAGLAPLGGGAREEQSHPRHQFLGGERLLDEGCRRSGSRLRASTSSPGVSRHEEDRESGPGAARALRSARAR